MILSTGLPGLPFSLIAYGEEQDIVRYVRGETREPINPFESAQGKIYDEFIIGTLEFAKQIIARAGSPQTLDLWKSLEKKRPILLERRNKILSYHSLTASKRRKIVENSDRVLRFETTLVCAHVGYWISKFPETTLVSLAESTLPVALRHELNVPDMGFKAKIEPDFVYPHFSAIGELKSGEPKRSDQIAITGYALAYERQHQEPIDFGIVLYLKVQDFKTPLFNVNSFRISDLDRRAFVDIRDSKARLARKEMEAHSNASS